MYTTQCPLVRIWPTVQTVGRIFTKALVVFEGLGANKSRIDELSQKFTVVPEINFFAPVTCQRLLNPPFTFSEIHSRGPPRLAVEGGGVEVVGRVHRV